jgi:hypothetical protein
MTYYILKQYVPNAEIWVASLYPGDPIYEYNTLLEAETALPEVEALYPDRRCKISEPILTSTRR